MSFELLNAAALQDCASLLKEQGLSSGLRFLNSRVPHRFTTVNQLHDGVLHTQFLHDKRGVVLTEHIQPVPLTHSFCQFVVRDGFFTSGNTADDARLEDHQYKGVYNAYIGVPILDNAGHLWGTLCHLDTQAIAVSDTEFDLLQRASRVLSRHLDFQALRLQAAAD